MSEQQLRRQSVREISSLFDNQNSVPIESIGNITVNEIRKRCSLRSNQQSSGIHNVHNDSNAIELRKKIADVPRSVSFNQHSSRNLNEDLKRRFLSQGSTDSRTSFEEVPRVNSIQDAESTVEVAVDVLEETELEINHSVEGSKHPDVNENKQEKLNDESLEENEMKSDTLNENGQNNIAEESDSEVFNSASDIISAIHSLNDTNKVDLKIDSQGVLGEETVTKNEKVISCRLLLKNGTDKCPWTGCHYEFKQHCKENHGHQLALCANEVVSWASTKLYTDTITVRIINEEIFWCYHRVTFDDTPSGMMYWTVLKEGSAEDEYYIKLAFYLRGNKFKRMIFEEWCLDSDTDVENVFRCKRCIAIPKEVLKLYFGVDESYMDQLHCEATIKLYKPNI